MSTVKTQYFLQSQWNNFALFVLFIDCWFNKQNFLITVEPLYNEVLGTMKITLLYQVSRYIRVKKQRNIKSWDQQNYLVIRGFCYIRPLYNEVPLYKELPVTTVYILRMSTIKIFNMVLWCKKDAWIMNHDNHDDDVTNQELYPRVKLIPTFAYGRSAFDNWTYHKNCTAV